MAKDDCSKYLVTIPTFMNPHVFFFVGKNDEHKKTLENKLKSLVELEDLFQAEKGDLVLVKFGGPCRAVVIDSRNKIGKEFTPSGVNKMYLCWLLDIGISLEDEKLYKMTDELKTIQPVAKRGCMLNVVPCALKFNFEKNKFANTLTDNFEIGINKEVWNQIYEPGNSFIFRTSYIKDGVYFGKIQIKTKSNEILNLADILKTMNLVQYDKNVFHNLMVANKHLNLEVLAPIIHVHKLTYSDKMFEVHVETKTTSTQNNCKWQFGDSKTFHAIDPVDSLVSESNNVNNKIGELKRSKQNELPPQANRHKEEKKSFVDEKSVQEISAAVVASESVHKPSKCDMQSITCKCMKCELRKEHNLLLLKSEILNTSCEDLKFVVRKPPQLLKIPQENGDYFQGKEILLHKDTSKKHNIFVHGPPALPAPVYFRSKMPFYHIVHKQLHRMQVATATPVQSHAWPSILAGKHTVIVDAPKSGKTLAYLPPLLTLLLDINRFRTICKSVANPLAIILCPGCKSAEHVKKTIKTLLSGLAHSKTLYVFTALPPLHAAVKLLKQCDVLIVTPIMLLQLLQANKVTLQRLRCLVFEDYDGLNDSFRHEVEKILTVSQEALSARLSNCSIQLVIVSCAWVAYVEQLVKQLHQHPVVCIGDYLQAALYGKQSLGIEYVTTDEESFDNLRELIENYRNKKIVIVCEHNQEIDSVYEFLNDCGFKSLKITHEDTFPKIECSERIWNNEAVSGYSIMLCSDWALKAVLNITNALLLVHFSLPSTWKRFSYRFRCLTDNYKSPVFESETSKKTEPVCKAVIFVSKFDHVHIPNLMKLFANIPVPKKYLPRYLTVIEKEINEEKKRTLEHYQVPLCENLKLFGSCSASNCCFRHNFSPVLDIPTELYSTGLLLYSVVHIKNISTYMVRLLEHISADGSKTRLCDEYVSLPLELIAYFSNCNPKVYAQGVTVGSMYAIQRGNKSFYRCVVRKVVDTNLDKPFLVTVYLVDIGCELNTNVSFLLKMPEHFKKIPPQIYEIYLANVGPPDCDTDYGFDSTEKLVQLLKTVNPKFEPTYCLSSAYFSLGRTVWVEDISLFLVDREGTNRDIKFSFKQKLKKSKLIESRPNHVAKLYSLCRAAKIDVCLADDHSISIPLPEKRAQPLWAYLDPLEESTNVYFCYAESDVLLLRLTSSTARFAQFENDVQQRAMRCNLPPVSDVQVGEYYLAKVPGSSLYNRALALSVDLDRRRIKVFFLDYGDTTFVDMSELKLLSNELILNFPFQVIECRLHGVKAKSGKWSPKTTKLFDKYKFASPRVHRCFMASVHNNEPAKLTKSRCYSVVLMFYVEDKLHILNRLILKESNEKPAKGQSLSTEFFTKYVEKLEASGVDPEKTKNPNKYDDELNICLDIQAYKLQLWTYLGKGSAEIKLPSLFEHPTGLYDSLSDKDILDDEDDLGKTIVYPPVTWYQTNEHVHLIVHLPEILQYDVSLRRNQDFKFQATFRRRTHQVILNLFAMVETIFQHAAEGCRVFITFSKMDHAEWDRLQMQTNYVKNITYDSGRLPLMNKLRIFENGFNMLNTVEENGLPINSQTDIMNTDDTDDDTEYFDED